MGVVVCVFLYGSDESLFFRQGWYLEKTETEVVQEEKGDLETAKRNRNFVLGT